MRMLRWMCDVMKLDKVSNERIKGTTKVGGKSGKEVEVVWACDEKRANWKRGTLRRKEDDGNESTRETEERKT